MLTSCDRNLWLWPAGRERFVLIALIIFPLSPQQASELAVAKERSILVNAGLCTTQQMWKKSIDPIRLLVPADRLCTD